jgi:hypothetical protein
MEKKTSSISLKTLFYLYLFIFGGLAIIGSIVVILMVYLFKTINFEDIISFTQNAYHSGLLLFIAFGFLAQMIDGALGMAYGVSSTSFLVSTGFHRLLPVQVFMLPKSLLQVFQEFLTGDLRISIKNYSFS